MWKIKNKEWRRRIFRYAPLFLWIGVILFASSTAGAMSNTSKFVRPFLMWLFPDLPEQTIILYHTYIRKLAHFAEYAVLGFFASRAFRYSTKRILHRFWWLCAALIVISVAVIDEFYQSFNVLRTSSVYDVGIDCAGGITMISLCLLYYFKKNNARGNTAGL